MGDRHPTDGVVDPWGSNMASFWMECLCGDHPVIHVNHPRKFDEKPVEPSLFLVKSMWLWGTVASIQCLKSSTVTWMPCPRPRSSDDHGSEANKPSM